MFEGAHIIGTGMKFLKLMNLAIACEPYEILFKI
jgi:hypothetical protein